MTTDTWLRAIERAAECLRCDDSRGHPASIAYLCQLENWILTLSHDEWDLPPMREPSVITGDIAAHHWVPSQPVQRSATRSDPRGVSTNNPYACIFTDADDETSEDEDEAGDQVLLQPTIPMSILRLFIRIRITISDLWAHLSKFQADAREWTEACKSLVNAITKSRDAMHLADSEISRYFQFENVGYSSGIQQLRDALEQDAEVVHVAVQSIVRVKDRYTDLAQRQMNKLEGILRPQWESRDQVKSRIGGDRWTSNPNPKNNYAAIRKENEQELLQLQKAMHSLEDAHVDELAIMTLAMKNRLVEDTGYRYNGKRPEEIMRYENTGRLGGFPDASNYGWSFTGSNPLSRVEFFEKTFNDDYSLVKLDWYYTTATVKTSLEHPRQGKTQLFAKSGVTPELYVQILENPRVHTDRRYQRKSPSNQRGQGRRRGNGRGRGRGRG